ncbi:MAG: hypothetical protein DWQ35_21560 [Planctomycetota bacterium]|nr:MAG: hypothetical protein DWQ35_21560 [Planctomycetota bacterium]
MVLPCCTSRSDTAAVLVMPSRTSASETPRLRIHGMSAASCTNAITPFCAEGVERSPRKPVQFDGQPALPT